MEDRWTDWVAYIVFAVLMTVYFHGFVDSLGAWGGLPYGLFMVVIWPSLKWLLRSVQRSEFWQSLSELFWR
jgi:hypothetical protein